MSWIEAVPESVATEAKAFNDSLEKLLAKQPTIDQIGHLAVRSARAEGRGMFGPLTFDKTAKVIDAGGVQVRVIAPPDGVTPKGIYIHMHGGGWTLGTSDSQDPALGRMAKATGLVCASIEYRLAPEHPFPAGPDDCETATHWLLEHAAELGAPARFAIGGESAGAHLAVLTMLRVRSPKIFAANLVYGAYDLSGTPSVRNWGSRNLVLSSNIIEYFTSGFLPGMDRRAPHISPLYADLAGLPPALFTVGTLDPLLDDTLFMEARYRAAGNTTQLRVWPHAVHGFNGFPIELGRMSDRDQAEFVASRLV
ncbi:MAG: alpha/beta hydrolase [Kofleriaceae bacterium]